MKHFKTLSSYLEYLELPMPEHPMLSVFTAFNDESLPCPKESSPPITNDCYTISFKKFIKGDLTYGRTKYDFTNGALFFIAPRQVLEWKNSFSRSYYQGSKFFYVSQKLRDSMITGLRNFLFFLFLANQF